LRNYCIRFSKITNMIKTKNLKILSFITIFSFLLLGCNGKLPGGDARKNPADPAELRVKKNLEEGRGFKLMDLKKKSEEVYLSLQVQMNFGEHH
jgi:hypothetical protein